VKTYADTSLLFSLYGTDAHSAKADAWRRANPDPLPLTPFHRLELRNALSLAVFQRRLTPAEIQSAWQEVENDPTAGILVARDAVWNHIFSDAETFALNHTSLIGCRTLDVLHVAVAKITGTAEFRTFDIRQADLANKVGMATIIP